MILSQFSDLKADLRQDESRSSRGFAQPSFEGANAPCNGMHDALSTRAVIAVKFLTADKDKAACNLPVDPAADQRGERQVRFNFT